MPVVTKVIEQKRRPNRRNVYLDGAFAFGLNDNVVARFRLREGMSISPEMVAEIAAGGGRQKCFYYAVKYFPARPPNTGGRRGEPGRRGGWGGGGGMPPRGWASDNRRILPDLPIREHIQRCKSQVPIITVRPRARWRLSPESAHDGHGRHHHWGDALLHGLLDRA